MFEIKEINPLFLLLWKYVREINHSKEFIGSKEIPRFSKITTSGTKTIVAIITIVNLNDSNESPIKRKSHLIIR